MPRTIGKIAIRAKAKNKYYDAVYQAAYIRHKADPEFREYAAFTATAYADGYIEGYVETAIERVRAMLLNQVSMQTIMRYTDLTREEIESLAN